MMDNNQKKQLIRAPPQQDGTKYRPLKLVYNNDIRLAQMPVNSCFKILRTVVRKYFPLLKAVLIKFLDSDGDLVTITCTSELRLAESSVDNNSNALRLHIVEVNPEQEPPLLEEEIEEVKPTEVDEPECKEVVFENWLFDFSQIFRTHIGIDLDSHIDLHKVKKEFLSKIVEIVTSELAQAPFDKAASKFEEVAALAYFNLGNVHVRGPKRMQKIVEAGPKETMNEQLVIAYDSVREEYKKAKRKYKKALLIKPDFFEGRLALGQQQFEMAKLLWSFVLAKKLDLSKWDPTEMMLLFNRAEINMRAATKMWKRKELTPEEAEVMSCQIHLLWGKMLFERCVIVYKLGLPSWDKNQQDAVVRFKLAGVSEPVISTVFKNIIGM